MTEPHDGSEAARRTVLVAVDDSDGSERVVRFVNRFFRGLDVKVIGINVGREPAVWTASDIGTETFLVWPPHDQPMPTRRDYDASLRKAARTVEVSGLRDDEVLSDLGDPVEHICGAAIKHRADLIVVGDNHKSAWRRLAEGSVTAGLQRRAPCPVLVVP